LVKKTAIVRAAAAASLVLVLTTACGGDSKRSETEEKAKAAGMTDEQFLACEDLVQGYKTVSPSDTQGKVELARKVNKRAQGIPELKDAGDALARSATLNADGWKVGADTFAGTCIKLGWPTS
jgi:hypothetical protein